MQEKSSIGTIIIVAVAILLGAILVQIIAEQTVAKTQLLSITDTINVDAAKVGQTNKTLESVTFTVSKPPTTWRTSDCPLTSVSIVNNSGASFTETTDWVMEKSTGVFYLKNATGIWNGFGGNNNVTLISYTYCPTEYINEGWQRTVLNLVPGFFVLAILLGAAFVIFYILKKEGVDFE